MSKLPAGPAKGPYSPKPTASAVMPVEEGLIFGIKRNYVFGIGAVVVAAVAFFVLRPSGDEGENDGAVATAKGKAKSKGRAGGGKNLCGVVHCNDEQRTKIRPLVQAYHEAIAEDDKALRKAYAALGSAFAEADYDDADLDDAYQAIAEHQEAVDGEARRTLTEIHKELSVDQREIVARLVARDGPASLFDRKSRGIPDRRKKDKRDKKDKKEKRKERREAKRAAKAGLESDATPDDARARHGAKMKLLGDKLRRDHEAAIKDDPNPDPEPVENLEEN